MSTESFDFPYGEKEDGFGGMMVLELTPDGLRPFGGNPFEDEESPFSIALRVTIGTMIISALLDAALEADLDSRPPIDDEVVWQRFQARDFYTMDQHMPPALALALYAGVDTCGANRRAGESMQHIVDDYRGGDKTPCCELPSCTRRAAITAMNRYDREAEA